MATGRNTTNFEPRELATFIFKTSSSQASSPAIQKALFLLICHPRVADVAAFDRANEVGFIAFAIQTIAASVSHKFVCAGDGYVLAL